MILAVLLALFHRPLLLWAIRLGGVKAAAGQKIALKWMVDGSVFGDLDIQKVDASAGAGSWLPKAEIGRVAVAYDLPKLYSEGPERFLGKLLLHDADVVIDLPKLPAGKPKPEPQAKGATSPPKLVWPRSIDLKNISATVVLGSGQRLTIRGLTLQAGEGMPGIFECAELRLEPGTLALSGLRAEIGIANDVISIRNLSLPFGARLDHLAADLSSFAQDKMNAELRITIGSGHIGGKAAVAGLFVPPLLLDADLAGAGLRSEELHSLAAAMPGLAANLRFAVPSISLRAKGDPLSPRAFDLDFAAEVRDVRAAGASLDAVAIAASSHGGEAELKQLHLSRMENQAEVTARASLPAEWQHWRQTAWAADIKAKVGDAAQIVDIKLPGKAAIQLRATAEGIGSTAKSVTGEIEAARIEFKKIRLDQAKAEFAVDGQMAKLRLPGVEIGKGNSVELDAMLRLDEAMPVEASWKISATDPQSAMERLGVPAPPEQLTGRIATEGSAKFAIKDVASGDYSRTLADVRLSVSELRYGEAAMSGASITAQVANGSAKVEACEMRLDARNAVKLNGEAALKPPFAFRGAADVRLPELTALNALTAMVKAPKIESGSLIARFDGTGELKPWRCGGSASLTAENAKITGMTEAASAKAEARFEGTNTTVSALNASYGPWRLEANGLVTDKLADLRDLKTWHKDLLLVTGRAKAPFDLMNGAADGDAADVDITASGLALREVCSLAKIAMQPEGTASATVKAHGRLPDLSAKVELQVKDARVPQTPQPFAAAAVDFKAALADGKLAAEMTAAQPPLEPLRLTAKLPVDVVNLKADPASVMQSPIEARLTMPDTDLGFVRQLAPDLLRSLPARGKMDWRIGGTIQQPVIEGGIDVAAGQIVFAKPDMPAVSDANIRIRARGQTVAIEDVSATVAGGRVKLGGTVDLGNTAEPKMDLRIEAKDACVFRDPATSVRANADITCRGTMRSAKVEGTVEAVRGRIFKEVNLLPSVMPSDLPPLPPSVDRSQQEFKLPEMLKDWSFDLRARTRDPVRIAGNLAVGAVSVDVKLAGTGAAPLLTGGANIDELMLRLPFSLIKVEKGVVTLNPAKPFDPRLDIRAASRVGKHAITLYVYGTAGAAKTRFVSMPPLPEPEIATLLATGTSLKGSPGELASEAMSRAVFLAASELYRKTFNKEKKVSDEPPKLHMTFQPAGSGRKSDSIQATYDITKKFRFTGRFSQGGGLRGMFDYLLRFGEAARSAEPAEKTGGVP